MTLNRRDMLKLGLVGLGATLSLDADAAEGEDVPRAVARLRRRLDRTSALDLDFLRVPDGLPAEHQERADIDATVIRSSMRALLLTGGVIDLGDDARAHPDVQGLVTDMGPELDHAVEGMFLRLATLPDADKARVRRALRDDPAVAEHVAAQLEHLAGKGGASAPRRVHLRALLQQVTWRLRHQPLDAVIGDVLEKTRGQEALHAGAPGPTREGPWADATERLRRAFVHPDAEAVELAAYDADKPARLRKRAGTEALVGAGLLVAGGILLGLGIALDAPVLTIASLVVFTAVVVMLIIALVTLIIAATVASTEIEEVPAPSP